MYQWCECWHGEQNLTQCFQQTIVVYANELGLHLLGLFKSNNVPSHYFHYHTKGISIIRGLQRAVGTDTFYE